MKRGLRAWSVVLLAACLIIIPVVAFAVSSVEAPAYTYRVEEQKAYISAYQGREKEVTVPDQLDGYPVVGVDEEVFEGNEYIVTVTLPESILSIGSALFSGCKNLEQVIFPETLSSIPSRTFRGCTSLRQVKIPPSVERVRNQAFYGCTALKSIVLPFNCELIGEEAFANCTSLADITLPDPSSGCIISQKAFDGTAWIENQGTEFVRYDTRIGRSVLLRYIGQDADVILPNDIYAVGLGAFTGNETIITVSIPLSCTKIEEYGFSGCIGLKEVHATERLYRTGPYAFAGCTSLTAFPYFNHLTQYVSEGAFDGCVSLYNIYLPNSIRRIDAYAFRRCESLVEVRLPESLQLLDKGVFDGCASLQTVHLPNTLLTIRERAFADCLSLTSMVLPEFLTTIESQAFANNANLTSLEIPMRVVNIAEDAFDGCDQLVLSVISGSAAEEYALRKGIAYVHHMQTADPFQYRFQAGEVSLRVYEGAEETLVIPPEVEGCPLVRIEVAALQNISSLREVTVPKSVHEVEDWAFSYCDMLEKVHFDEGIQSIGADAFSGCTSLKQVNLPASITYIGENAFRECPEVVVMVQQGSFAEAYAQENNLRIEFMVPFATP